MALHGEQGAFASLTWPGSGLGTGLGGSYDNLIGLPPIVNGPVKASP